MLFPGHGPWAPSRFLAVCALVSSIRAVPKHATARGWTTMIGGVHAVGLCPYSCQGGVLESCRSSDDVISEDIDNEDNLSHQTFNDEDADMYLEIDLFGTADLNEDDRIDALL